MSFKHELGKEVKDKVTDFKGILIGRTEYLMGCNCYGIAPKINTDGKRGLVEWFDEGRIEILGNGILPEEVSVEKNGADSNDYPLNTN